jgi:Tfp pilus assembly protein PilO
VSAWRGANRWLWGVAAGLLVANALALVLLILPARSQRIEQENRLLDLQRQVRTLQREAQSGQGMLAALREVEEFAQGYPPQADLVSLVGRLTTGARALALEVPSVSYHPEAVKETDLTKVTLSMGVQGSYGNIRRYLYELEGLRRQLVIERLAIREAKGAAALDLQLQLALYVR